MTRGQTDRLGYAVATRESGILVSPVYDTRGQAVTMADVLARASATTTYGARCYIAVEVRS